jgi:hypothetical protein
MAVGLGDRLQGNIVRQRIGSGMVLESHLHEEGFPIMRKLFIEEPNGFQEHHEESLLLDRLANIPHPQNSNQPLYEVTVLNIATDETGRHYFELPSPHWVNYDLFDLRIGDPKLIGTITQLYKNIKDSSAEPDKLIDALQYRIALQNPVTFQESQRLLILKFS